MRVRNVYRGMVGAVRAARVLEGYRPKKVTVRSLLGWASQFPKEWRADLLEVAANLRFVSEAETVDWLETLNDGILRRLRRDGIGEKNVIYVATDKAGSSSGVMLNLLRDRANLERRGAVFVHYGEANKIQELTRRLRFGAVVYVDDFAGTGKQFLRSRKSVAESVVGAFSEFFLLPCICEEARCRIEREGVKAESGFVHTKSERPLRGECEFLEARVRDGLLALSSRHWKKKVGMGFDGLATNVVFYRNAPEHYAADPSW